ASSLDASVLAFAIAHIGQVVTDPLATGCAALVSAAFRSAGAKPQWQLGTAGSISDHYIWGQLVYQRDKNAGYSSVGGLADIRPGDVIQFDNYTENGPGGTGANAPHHTAIVQSVNPTTGELDVIQQNANGDPSTEKGHYDLNAITSGVVSIYRPVAG